MGLFIPGMVIMVAIVLVVVGLYVVRQNRVVGPNEIGIFYGLKSYGKDATGQDKPYLVLSGGGRIKRPIFERYQPMSRLAFQISIDEEGVPNKDSVKIRVRGIASCILSDKPENQVLAAQQFLGKSEAEVQVFLGNILKGHLRGIIGKMDINQLLRQRDTFNQEVSRESKTEIEAHGYELKSISIQDINDTEGYIDALGKQAVADAKADAEIKVAMAGRKQAVEVSNAQRESQLVEADNAAIVAEAEKNRDVKKAGYKVETETRKAEAEMAGAIATAARQQVLVVAEAERDRAEKEAQIGVQMKERERRTAELEATVVAEAEANKSTKVIAAEGDKQQRIISAEAEAQVLTTTADAKKRATVLEGEGIAAATEAKLVATAKGEAAGKREALLAEAEGTEKLAHALAQMSDSARMIIILDKLPILLESGGDAAAKVMEAIFKSVAAPLGQIDNLSIVDMGGSGNGVNKIAGIVPDVVFQFLAKAKASGMDLSAILGKFGIDASGLDTLLAGVGPKALPGSSDGKSGAE